MRKLTSGAVKSILLCKETVGQSLIDWTERWITQLVREHSYPPQLVSADFIWKLSSYFSPTVALEILQQIRSDYRSAFPISETKDDELINLTIE